MARTVALARHYSRRQASPDPAVPAVACCAPASADRRSWPEPGEVAAAVAWLASPEALWASGAVIDLNGASYLR